LAATLREAPMMPAGLRNRIDVFFDPDHAGWFTSVQGAKDVTLFLDLAEGGPPLPVTEAARATPTRSWPRTVRKSTTSPPWSNTAGVHRDWRQTRSVTTRNAELGRADMPAERSRKRAGV
jgi:hypothetical protein